MGWTGEIFDPHGTGDAGASSVLSRASFSAVSRRPGGGDASASALVRGILGQAGPLNPGERRELESLSRERDRDILCESLFSLGRRFENGDRLQAAQVIFSTLANSEVSGVPSTIRQRAEQRLNAINGVGATGPRSEYLARRLARQAIDPSMIVGMAAAGAVFRTVRLAALSRLAATAVPSLVTRGLGARLLASSIGFAAEAPAFTAAVRGANVLLGREQDWSPGAIWHEFAGGATTLFCLKITGGLTGAALRRLNGNLAPAQLSLTRRTLSGVLPQAGTFAGILSGHKLEEIFGFRPHLDDATFLTDGLSTLLNFHVGGKLSHHALGERFRQSEQAIDMRNQALEAAMEQGPSRPASPIWQRLRGFARQVALAPLWMMMGAVGEGGGGLGGGPRGEGSAESTRATDRIDTTPTDRGSSDTLVSPPEPTPSHPRDTARVFPPPPVAPPRPPRFRPRVQIDDATLARLERFPRRAQERHEKSGEPNPVFFGLNSLRWWLGLIRRDAADLGAEAIVQGGRILFGRFQESAAEQERVERKLREIAAQANVRAELERPAVGEWWGQAWERAVADASVGPTLPAEILRRIRASDPAKAEEFLMQLAARDFERSEGIREAAERETSVLPRADREIQGFLGQLRTALERGDLNAANSIIEEAYRRIWGRSDLSQIVSEIDSLQAAAEGREANEVSPPLAPPGPRPVDLMQSLLQGLLQRAAAPTEEIRANRASFLVRLGYCLQNLGQLTRFREIESQAVALGMGPGVFRQEVSNLDDALLVPSSTVGMPDLPHFTDLIRGGRLAEALEVVAGTSSPQLKVELLALLVRVAGESGHVAELIAELAPPTNPGSDRERQWTLEAFTDRVMFELQEIKQNLPNSNLQAEVRRQILGQLASIAEKFIGRSSRAEKLHGQLLRWQMDIPHVANPTVILPAMNTNAFVEVSRLVQDGRIGEAFERVERYSDAPYLATSLLNVIVKGARPLLTGDPGNFTAPLPRPDAVWARIWTMAYRFGQELGSTSFHDAPTFSYLSRIFRAQGETAMAEEFYRKAREGGSRETVIQRPDGKLSNSVLDLVEAHQKGDWLLNGRLREPDLNQITGLLRTGWEDALNYIDRMPIGDREIALAYLTKLFSEREGPLQPIVFPANLVPEQIQSMLALRVQQLGEKIKPPKWNFGVRPAQMLAHLGWALSRLGQGQKAADFFRRAADALIGDPKNSMDSNYEEERARTWELINRAKAGDWLVPDLTTEIAAVGQWAVRGQWGEAVNQALGLPEHHQAIALAQLARLFSTRVGTGSAVPPSGESRPPRYNLDSLPTRAIETIPEEHRHLIPRLRSDPVLFPRFRRALDELASLIQAPDRIAIRLFGPPGTGKTTLPEIIAGRMGVPLLRFPISKRTDPSDFDGSWRLTQVNGELVPVFEEGVTTVAMERGYHLVMDEPDLGRPGVLAYVNNVSAPGRTAWVRGRDGRLREIEVHSDFLVWVTENGQRELGREEHGRDFLRRFVPYQVGTWTTEEITTVLAERFENYGGQARWERRTSEMMAQFHTQVQRLAQGMVDLQNRQVLPPLGSGVGQRVEFTPRSILRLAQRLVAQGALTPESLSRAIRSEYILPLAEGTDRELVWNQARAAFAPLLRQRGWAADAIGPGSIPQPTLASLSTRFLDGRPIPQGDFEWTGQALRIAEEMLWDRSLGIDTMLLGDAGEGKTELPRQIAELLRAEYFQKTVSSETDEEDLVGGPGRGENGEITFVPDIVTLAAERGGILHLDEYLLADTGRLESVMNPLMDDARAVFLKNPYRRIDRHPGLSVILTSNPPWEFQDRHEHSAAAMSRVAVIYLSGEFGMQPADRLQILRRWAGGSPVAPPGEAGGSSGGGGGGGDHPNRRPGASAPGGEDGSPLATRIQLPISMENPTQFIDIRQFRPDGWAPQNNERNLTLPALRATVQPARTREGERQRVVDLNPDVAARFGLPHQLVFDLGEGRLLEITDDGSFVPLRRETTQAIQRYAARLTRQTQVDMGLTTGRVFRINYGLMTGHSTALEHGTIRLDIADMLRRPHLAALGIGKHEWSHAAIDRGSERYDAHEPGRLLANVIGDPRMNEYAASLREDFREQIEVMSEDCWPAVPDSETLQGMREKLPHEQFADGIIYGWRLGRVPDWIENPTVRGALEEALPLARPAFTLFPESTQAHHVDAAAEKFYRIVDQVWPIYERLLPESVQELVRRMEAGATPEQLIQEVLQQALQMMAAGSSGPEGRAPAPSETGPGGREVSPSEEARQEGTEPSHREEGEGGSPSPAANSEGQASSTVPLTREVLEQLAWRILQARAKQLADQFEPQDPGLRQRREEQIAAAQRQAQAREENSGEPERVNEPPPPPVPQPLSEQERQEIEQAEREALAQSVEGDLFRRMVPPRAIQAAQRLRRILPPENPTYLEGHFTTGKRLDRRKAVQEAIAPVGNGRVMLRRIRPGERDAQMVIVSDVSFSMVSAGAVENSTRASAAAIYLCEQLGIDYGEILFDQKVTIAKRLGGPLRTYPKKNELLNRKREAFGGNDTQMREPLAMAIEWLRARPARTNMIVLITDGNEGHSAYPKTLPELEAEAERAGIHLVVLAMGQAQRSVPQNFKHYRFSQADGSDIPDQLVELIEEAHGRRFGGR